MNSIQLGNFTVNEESDPYIIAEIGVNHEASMSKAKELIELAKLGGANAAKFQTYKAETIASKNSPAYWDLSKEKTKSQFELFKKYDKFGEKEYILLYEHCKKVGIDFVSTPFDSKSIDFLDPLMSFYKIASADITNLPFLRKIASKNKPIILSTGCSNYKEIDFALSVLNLPNNKISLLHCILNYPTIDINANLGMISHLKRKYPKNIIGYSDHTLPDNEMFSIQISYMLGARIIEKHFTYDKNIPGNDHYHSMDFNDCKRIISNIDRTKRLVGFCDEKKPIHSEKKSILNARRSIVINKNLLKGHVICENDLIYKRPGNGISTVFWDDVIGKRINKNLSEDHILNWDDIIK